MKQILLFFAFFYFHHINSQTLQTIKIKKSEETFYFFQKGNPTDTISKGKGDVFYLTVKENLKNRLIILIENGQLLKTENDSVFKLNYIKGISYECLFEKIMIKDLDAKINQRKSSDSSQYSKYEFKCLINGVSTTVQQNVVFRFKLKNELNFILENKFYYRN